MESFYYQTYIRERIAIREAHKLTAVIHQDMPVEEFINQVDTLSSLLKGYTTRQLCALYPQHTADLV